MEAFGEPGVATQEDCIRALEAARKRLGESPTKAQYEQLDLTPSASTILRHCGSWNAAKEQADLSTNSSTGSRVEPKPDDISLPDGVEWGSLTQDQRWHYRNRERNAERTRERRRGLRQWLCDQKGNQSGCIRCGEPDPIRLDFHHRNSESKKMDVNKMVLHGYSKTAIRTEIEKCELLCANCHWREHHSLPSALSTLDTSSLYGGNPRSALRDALLNTRTAGVDKEEYVRAWTYAYQRTQGCQYCDEKDPVCLQFHHTGDDKTMGVGEMITHSFPIEDVLTEIGKCTVLCANCHRAEHQRAPGSVSD